MSDRRLGVALFALALVLGGGLRFASLGTDSLWLDELVTLQRTAPGGAAVQPRDQVLMPAPDTTSMRSAPSSRPEQLREPPLYYSLAARWRTSFAGDDDGRLRLLSATTSFLAIPALFAAGLALGGPVVGGAAALFGALAGTAIHFAHEARPAALSMALAAILLALLARLRERPGTAPAVLLGFTALATIATHVTAGGLLLGLLAWSGATLAGEARKQAGVALLAAFVVGFALLGSTPLDGLLAPLPQRETAPAFSVADVSERLLRLPRRLLSEPATDWNRGLFWTPETGFDAAANQVSLRVGPVEALLALAFLAPWLVAGERRAALWLPWSALVGVIAPATLRDLTASDTQLLALTTMAIAAPTVPLLAALVLPTAGRRRVLALAAGVAWLLSGAWTAAPVGKADLRGLARYVDERSGTGVLLPESGTPWWYVDTLQRALSHYAPSAERPLLLSSGAANEAAMEQLARAGRGVIVISAARVNSPFDFLPAGWVLLDFQQFEGAATAWHVTALAGADGAGSGPLDDQGHALTPADAQRRQPPAQPSHLEGVQ